MHKNCALVRNDDETISLFAVSNDGGIHLDWQRDRPKEVREEVYAAALRDNEIWLQDRRDYTTYVYRRPFTDSSIMDSTPENDTHHFVTDSRYKSLWPEPLRTVETMRKYWRLLDVLSTGLVVYEEWIPDGPLKGTERDRDFFAEEFHLNMLLCSGGGITHQLPVPGWETEELLCGITADMDEETKEQIRADNLRDRMASYTSVCADSTMPLICAGKLALVSPSSAYFKIRQENGEYSVHSHIEI